MTLRLLPTPIPGSAIETAEASVREAIAEYRRHGPWQPDLAKLTEAIAKRNEWLRNTEDS